MQQKRELLNMTNIGANNPIPQAAFDAIEEIIQKDEGGWKLTANKDDPDGGWTYGGCTKKLLVTKGVALEICSFADMYHYCNDPKIDAMNKELIRRVYYEEFYAPLVKKFGYCDAAMLSCAVNCGVQTAIDIENKIYHTRKVTNSERFLSPMVAALCHN
jgi:hypothetical protein